MLGLLNTVLSRGGSLLTYVKDGLVMANRFLTPPKLTFPVDASAEFNGTSDYIEVNPAPVGSESALTISCWVNTTNTAVRGLVSKGTGGFSDFVLFGNLSPYKIGIYLQTTTANSGNVYSTTTLNDGKWHFMTATWDGSNVRVYVDGSLENSAALTGTLNNSQNNMYIGAYSDDDNYLDGNLANVAFWNRALSSDEINSVMWKTYEQISATESNGLQAWYKLSASEALSGDSTATLTTYANANALTFEAPACVQTALNAFPDITDARLYSANYDIRVSADGGNVESLNCVETELNAIL